MSPLWGCCGGGWGEGFDCDGELFLDFLFPFSSSQYVSDSLCLLPFPHGKDIHNSQLGNVKEPAVFKAFMDNSCSLARTKHALLFASKHD